MAESHPRATTVDEYIAGFPEDVGRQLEAVRHAIHKAAPDAREAIRFGIPAFVLHGNLVHFGAFGDHIDFYPVPSGVDAFARELAGYRQGRGSARFPLGQPLPLKLISRIVRFRATQNEARVASGYRRAR